VRDPLADEPARRRHAPSPRLGADGWWLDLHRVGGGAALPGISDEVARYRDIFGYG
jgi:hypothetical protein